MNRNFHADGYSETIPNNVLAELAKAHAEECSVHFEQNPIKSRGRRVLSMDYTRRHSQYNGEGIPQATCSQRPSSDLPLFALA